MSTESDTKPAASSLPQGYRQGLVTAITVFLGFSLSFMRFWNFESPGTWTWKAAMAAAIVAGGIGVQLLALFRSLGLEDDQPARYRQTVRFFLVGVVVVVIGVGIATLVA